MGEEIALDVEEFCAFNEGLHLVRLQMLEFELLCSAQVCDQ